MNIEHTSCLPPHPHDPAVFQQRPCSSPEYARTVAVDKRSASSKRESNCVVHHCISAEASLAYVDL